MALVGGKSFEEMGEELIVDENQESKVQVTLTPMKKTFLLSRKKANQLEIYMMPNCV